MLVRPTGGLNPEFAISFQFDYYPMSNNNNAKKGAGKKAGAGGMGKKKRKGGPGGAAGQASWVGALTKYMRLLDDPCAGDLVNAPYAGSGSGYLIRTVNQVTLQGMGVGDTATGANFVCQLTPYNFPAPFVGTVSPMGQTQNCNSISMQNFVTNPMVVKSYRPVAACMRFISNGSIATRSGIIGRVYNASRSLIVGDAASGHSLMPYMAHQDTNGSVVHEVKWLPSFADERYGNVDDNNISGAGTCTIVGTNVDITHGVAGSFSINGYVEITVVWEWVPTSTGASGADGVVSNTPTVPGFTLQDAMSKIRDMGAFLYGRSEAISAAYSIARSYGRARGPGLLTNY